MKQTGVRGFSPSYVSLVTEQVRRFNNLYYMGAQKSAPDFEKAVIQNIVSMAPPSIRDQASKTARKLDLSLRALPLQIKPKPRQPQFDYENELHIAKQILIFAAFTDVMTLFHSVNFFLTEPTAEVEPR